MQVKEQDGVHIIELTARIDAASAPELERVCNGLLDAGQYKIICDFSGNKYVSSVGLRVFLSTLKRTTKAGGLLVLCGLNPGVTEIFDMTGLTDLFKVFDSTATALVFFRSEFPPRIAAKESKPFGTIEEIVIDRKPRDATLAYLTPQKKVRMDEKI